MNEHVFTQRLLPAALGLLGLASWASAQAPTHTILGSAANDRFGVSVAGGKDVNGDGNSDLVIGAPENLNIFTPGTGYVRVVSGATGNTYTTWMGDNLFDSFGQSVAVSNDMNVPLDGRADVVVGAPDASVSLSQAGQVQVRSGATGAVLHKIDGDFAGDQLGFAVAAPGDVDGDGVPDFIASAPFHSQVIANGGMVRVYSGADGSVIHTFLGSANNGRFGWSVAGGDVNGDGRADIVVGSLFGGVRVYNGATGGVLYNIPGGASDILGRSVAVVPDLSGDGIADVVAGASQEDIFNPGTGFVRAYNGTNGAVLWTRNGAVIGDRFGLSLGSAGFWDADGRADVVVGALPQTQTTPGYVRVLSGLDGSVLADIVSPVANNGFGTSVAGIGDWNTNGKTDIAVGVAIDSTAGVGAGKVEVYESGNQSCGVVTSYCGQATTNSTGVKANLSNAGSTSVAAANFVLVCTQLPPNQAALAFYGANQANVPFVNGFRCVANPIFRLNPPVNGGPAGIIAINVNLANPQAPITGGSTWNFQVWYRDPVAGGAGSNTSTALQVGFCP